MQTLCLPYKPQILQWGLIHVERGLLREIADALFGLFRLFKNIISIDPDMPLRRGQAPGHNIHSGRLSRAVRSQEAVNMTLLDLKGKVIDRHEIAVVFCQVLNCYHSLPPRTYVGHPAVRPRLKKAGAPGQRFSLPPVPLPARKQGPVLL